MAKVTAAEQAMTFQVPDGVEATLASRRPQDGRRTLHPRLPLPVPPVPGSQPTHDTRLRHLDKLNAGFPSPFPHASVPGVAHTRAGFFMGDEESEARLPSELLEHGHRLSMPRNKTDAETGERFGHCHETLMLKARVPWRPLGLGVDFRLIEKRCEDCPALSPCQRHGERRMIRHAEVSLEPDTDRGADRHS